MHHAIYGHAAELVAIYSAERSATDVDPIVNTDALSAGDAFSSEEGEENEKETATLDGERDQFRGSQFIVNQSTVDLCQYATLVRACLTEGEVRMMEIAFSRKALMYGLNCITQGWDIQQRVLCCNCGRQAINKCCEGTTVTWVSCDVVEQMRHLWSRLEKSVHEIWNAVKQDIVLDSPGCHGRLKTIIKKESSPAIHLLLSSDGVQVSGTRDKVWPVLLSVLNIYRKQRMLKKNVIIVGIISGVVDPSPAIFSEVIELLQIQLRRFSCVAGVSAHISAIVGDKPAIAKMYNFAHHNSAGSCFYCECMDTRIKINRSKERRHSSTGLIVGFKGPSKANELVPIFDVSLDVFHHMSEGVHKEIVNGMLIQSIWSLVGKLDETWLQVKLPFGWKSWRKGTCYQGTVFSNVFIFGCSRIAWSGMQFKHREAKIIIMIHVFFYCASSLATFEENLQLKEDCRQLLEVAGRLYFKISGRFTPKWHELSFHAIDAITTQGPLGDHSTSLTESILCNLKVDIAKHHTRDKPKSSFAGG